MLNLSNTIFKWNDRAMILLALLKWAILYFNKIVDTHNETAYQSNTILKFDKINKIIINKNEKIRLITI